MRAEELASVPGLVTLCRRAVRAGLVPRSEAGVLNLVAAAGHARRVASRNPAGLFAAVVRRGLWSYISGEDEDRARAAARAVWAVVTERSASEHRPHERLAAGPSLPRERVRELVWASLGLAVGGAASRATPCS